MIQKFGEGKMETRQEPDRGSASSGKISIIIPTYNCERYISETIDSILSQTYKNIEVIVVDDGSNDRTAEIVSAYGEPVRLILQINSGVCTARNRGISESVGEYICLMDHDDYWFPDKLSQQVELLKENPDSGIVYSAFIRWAHDINGIFPAPATFDLNKYSTGTDPVFSGWIYHQFLLDCWMLTSTAMFRSEVFRTCGVFDESLPYSEDWEMWLRISREYPFVCMNKPTTLYRQHKQQGNRVVRDIDYRTELLANAKRKWGLSSRDGRATARHRFLSQLAAYHAAFGLGHLNGGKLSIAINSFFKAWLHSPLNLKYLAYIPASIIGWRPKW